MKKVLLLIILLFQFAPTWSQNFEQIEKELSAQTGEDFFIDALQLSNYYFDQKKYLRSQSLAASAFDKAQRIGDKKYMAKSLTQEARAMIELPTKVRTNQRRATKMLELSNEITSDKNLKISNFKLLKKIARIRGKQRDIEKFNQEIAILEGKEEELLTDEKRGLFGNRRKTKEKIAELSEERASLSETVESLEAREELLEQQQEQLTLKIAAKEAAIKEMSKEQIEAELMVVEQQRLLDSLAFVNEKAAMERVQKEMEEGMKIAELKSQIQLEKNQQNILIACVVIALIIAFGLFLRFMGIRQHNRVLEEKNRIIEKERERSEGLLLNILPKIVAEELKEKGAAKAQRFNEATVLFTDFKNFTQIANKMSPEQLVKELDYCFNAFDQIIEKNGLEKIKTIGDSYMCAGGMPMGSHCQPSDVVRAALEIQNFLAKWKAEKLAKKEPFFEARVGIHTGPIVAGVVGKKKFAYDIWGNTVNVASRMETSGEPGKVNVSMDTYNLIKDDFKCIHRGKLKAKNYGEVDMYFVEKSIREN